MEFQRHTVHTRCLYPTQDEAEKVSDELCRRGWGDTQPHEVIISPTVSGWFVTAVDQSTAQVEIFAKRDLVGEEVHRILTSEEPEELQQVEWSPVRSFSPEDARKKAAELEGKYASVRAVQNSNGSYRIIMQPVEDGPNYHLRENGTFQP